MQARETCHASLAWGEIIAISTVIFSRDPTQISAYDCIRMEDVHLLRTVIALPGDVQAERDAMCNALTISATPERIAVHTG